MDRAVSLRHSAAPYSSDAEPLTFASPIRVAEAAAVDESKTKRQHLSLLASNYLSRISNSPCLVLCIVTALVVISLAFHSRSLVCVSLYDPVSRIGSGLLRPDALSRISGILEFPGEVVIAALVIVMMQGFELEERNSGRRQWMYKSYVDQVKLGGVLEEKCEIILTTVIRQSPMRNIFRTAGLLNQF